jgi:hypothetical protein
LYIGLAFIANNVSIIKYKSDDEYTSKEINVDTNTKLIEVSAGLCTGTLRAGAIEAKINEILTGESNLDTYTLMRMLQKRLDNE